ncbi:protein-lysine N-methyltransferase NDAI_0A05980 [Naumovozyma dairenensis CBS 421]|uniref:SET domain-containing protein n=1 Tax=Naumovozyma dairenensis (strain ATCC 10597 / BCRC 20456 / CBS 421 / NBRC 0211 / NRRL Y-12639) TaxID=1071378 RepID=G0W4L5_NAUDC|nr:hypothetical protein NDAI_0A05980 [Naumovozyma dairenensis CBS 421]CCD22753.1 hypothetical protein NDAI_0A05980 [Naumovozyma dairenensis CBS 421]
MNNHDNNTFFFFNTNVKEVLIMFETTQESRYDLLDFVKKAEGKFLTSHCEISKSPTATGLGIIATQDIGEGTKIISIPKSAIFSASNSNIANLLQDEEIDGMFALNIAFIYEISTFKDTSHWYPYLKHIPLKNTETDEPILPVSFWTEKQKRLLKGTTADVFHKILEPQEEVMEGFELAIELAQKWSDEFGLSIPEYYLSLNDPNDKDEFDTKFKRFCSLAFALSSRVLEIDQFHESGLVPIVDLINHHCKNVNAEFLSLFDVCDKCGESGTCRHLLAEEAEEAIEMAKLDQNHLKVDANGATINDIISMETIIELEKDHNEPFSDEEDDKQGMSKPEEELNNPDDYVDIVTTRGILKGEEIFISYGPLPNAFLLAKCGFTMADNPFDIVYAGNSLTKMLNEKQYSKCEERIRWWIQAGRDLFLKWYKELEEQIGSDEESEEESAEEEEQEIDDNDDNEEKWLEDLCWDRKSKLTPAFKALVTLMSMNEHTWQAYFQHIREERDLNKSLRSLAPKVMNTAAKKIIRALAASRLSELPLKTGAEEESLVDPLTLRYLETLRQGEVKILRHKSLE